MHPREAKNMIVFINLVIDHMKNVFVCYFYRLHPIDQANLTPSTNGGRRKFCCHFHVPYYQESFGERAGNGALGAFWDHFDVLFLFLFP